MPELFLSSGRLHYLDQGHGVPLVLLHANPGDSRDFDDILPALAAEYRVLALDWPGYGRSDLPPRPSTWNALNAYTVLCEFLDALRLPPAIFVGNSLGGNAAARLAIEAPERVRALVLVAGGGFTPHNAITRAFCRLQGSRWALPPRWWAALYLRKRTPSVQAMLARAAGVQSEPARRILNRAIWRSFAEADHDLRARAAAIQAPTLLLYGRDDPALPARKDGHEAARCIPQARLKIMPCGHASFAEVPALLLDALQPFLREALSSPAPNAAPPHAAGSGVPA